ncbi:MAG: inorganic phosphate transporter [Cyclobacteriaceae bacterium]
MFDLDVSMSLLLILFILAACSFEFVNGFHDTANAVATVIYTNTLKPWFAVIWSGIWNFLGVYWGGIAVAMGIVNLLPLESLMDQNLSHSLSMVAALLISAIFWNVLTWYYGIPCSSSHTLISAIIGVGIAYYLLPGAAGDGVNWTKAKEIGLSLLLSPAVGFTLTILLMLLLRMLTRKTKEGEDLFKEPKKNTAPPFWIRAILIVTCTLVSFFHGSNDGQKGVGLVMLILIAIVPTYFALNSDVDLSKLQDPLYKIEQSLSRIDSTSLSEKDRETYLKVSAIQSGLTAQFTSAKSVSEIPSADRFSIRRDVMVMDKGVKNLIKHDDVVISTTDEKSLETNMKSLRKVTDYSPSWVLLIISLSLGIGTMIGWKRIVRTIGEKIGKEHLTYAQGASAEMVASFTIGMSSFWGWPVSTTQVLSSAIAGSMVASKGVKNLQPATVRNILLTWALTLPVVVTLSGLLFLLFRNIFE